ncbi:MAG: hypothetical protein ACFFD9_08255 [Candidatus Thorarchaeota archaeon]
MTRDEEDGPMRARADLLDIIRRDPDITDIVVTIVENELKDIRDKDVVAKISNTLTDAATSSGVEIEVKDNVLYWLTETAPDVRQMILVKTIEDLLETPECRDATLEALARLSSKDNVDMVFAWVDSNVLTLNQAVFVLIYPDSSDALK